MENGDYVVAIDLGTNTVATVVGTRGEGGKVRIIDCEISPVQGVVRSEIKNVELVAQSIKRTIEAIEARQQITIREAYAGISGQHIRCVKYPYYVFVGRDGEIREEDVQKLHESMGNVQAPDGETIIQIIPQNYIVDDEETMNPVGAFGNKLEAVFNFVLGDNNAVSRVKRCVAKGLKSGRQGFSSTPSLRPRLWPPRTRRRRVWPWSISRRYDRRDRILQEQRPPCGHRARWAATRSTAISVPTAFLNAMSRA